MKLPQKSIYLLAFAALTAPATAQLPEETPGCACPGSECAGETSQLGVCTLVKWNIDLGLTDDTTEAICDVVANSTEFQEDRGTESEPYFFTTGGGVTTGPWASVGGTTTEVGRGSCLDAYQRQNSCLAETPEGLDRLSGSTSQVEPNSCGQVTVNFPNETEFSYSTVCRGYFDINEGVATYGMDVRYAIHSEGQDVDLCDEENIGGVATLLTEESWQQQPGSRYACGEITYEDETYYVMLINLGNEPCSAGPTSAPTPSPSDSTAASVGVSMMLLVFGAAMFVL
ncbi:MAG: hypothetical protein SGILL_009598 [Bacillariaceae sp.]